MTPREELGKLLWTTNPTHSPYEWETTDERVRQKYCAWADRLLPWVEERERAIADSERERRRMAVSAAVAAERDRCAKKICTGCSEEWPIEDGAHIAKMRNGYNARIPCAAAAIREGRKP